MHSTKHQLNCSILGKAGINLEGKVTWFRAYNTK